MDWYLTHDTSLEELLAYFADSRHPVCFLLQGRQAVGLVTPADFGKAVARMGLYVYLAELEILLARFLRQCKLSEDEILKLFSRKRQSELAAKANNYELPLLELLNLSELLNILEKNELAYKELGFPSRRAVKRATSGLVELRNFVAHPVREKRMPVSDLANRLERAQRLTERLRAAVKSAG